MFQQIRSTIRLIGFTMFACSVCPGQINTATLLGTVTDPQGAVVTGAVVNIENVGTRHRAAYRFVNDHPDGLAVVISQDGGVSFVANREEQVVFWEQSVSP